MIVPFTLVFSWNALTAALYASEFSTNAVSNSAILASAFFNLSTASAPIAAIWAASLPKLLTSFLAATIGEDEYVIEKCKEEGIEVQTGMFREEMKVRLLKK